jgi:hypothetical protein
MKITVSYQIAAAYDDGAGNTTTYVYAIFADKEVTVPDGDIWKINWFDLGLPLNAITATAATGTAGTPAGSPPAAGGRTIAIDTKGVCTFVDANEELFYVTITLTPSDQPTHEYEFDVFADYVVSGEFAAIKFYDAAASLIESFSNPTETPVLEDQTLPVAAAIKAQFNLNATDVANAQLPSSLAVGFCEKDLVSRPYNGQFIEAGVKLLLAAKAMKRRANRRSSLGWLGPIVPEIATYIQGDGPLDMYIPQANYQVNYAV